LKETVLPVSEQDRFRSSKEREGGDTARRKVKNSHLAGWGTAKTSQNPDMMKMWRVGSIRRKLKISAVKKGRKQQLHPNLKQDQGRNALD